MQTAPISEAEIAVSELRREFGERTALCGISFSLRAGQTLAVLGPNGAGKTTLLRVLATLLRPSGGSVRVFDCELPAEAWRVRAHIGYLGHEPLLYRDLSGRENLRFCARLHGLEPAAAEKRTSELLVALGIDRRADERVATLSAGMRQRLAVARCLLHRPRVLLLDEPDVHLDAAGRELAAGLFQASRASCVLVSHDPARALRQADRALLLGGDGRAIAECPAAELDAADAEAIVAGAAR